MARNRHWIGVSVLGLGASLVAGCLSDQPDFARPKQSLALDITSQPEARQVRLQKPDPGPQQALPPIDPKVYMPQPPPAANSGVQQTAATSRGTVRVSIRAWVNGRPIFDDEVMNMAGADLARLYGSPSSQNSQKAAELVNGVIEQLIDQEVMYQDAMKKLEKNSPNALKQLKKFVDQEFDKTLEKWNQAKVPQERIQEMEPVARRLLERNLISTEYARSRIMDTVKAAVNIELIRDYYETHKNEFQTVDKVVWQNIFIPLSPNLPTVEEAKKFAEELIYKCRNSEDFNRLMAYNDGPSKLYNGEGLGQRRGEIRPAELESHLFQLREGQIGPVIPFTTGVHLMRVVKREYAAQLPMDDKVQNTIRKKLENELADREYKRIVRELRGRAVIRVERTAS